MLDSSIAGLSLQLQARLSLLLSVFQAWVFCHRLESSIKGLSLLSQTYKLESSNPGLSFLLLVTGLNFLL